MWLLGIFVLMSFSAGVVGLANRRRETVVLTPHWNYVRLGESYALIIGSLAGLSLAAGGISFLSERMADIDRIQRYV